MCIKKGSSKVRKMMKKLTALAFGIAVAVSLTGCGSLTGGKRIIRVSHAQSETHPEHLGLLAFKEYVEEKLGDKYEVQIFPNELLGSAQKAIELTQTGAIDFVVAGTANLEDMGLTVEIQKEYSELNDDGTPVTDPGYAVSTTPAAGNSVSAGDSVTLIVSRGVDYGDSVEVPSVVGMTKNDAVTTFGKFLNVEVKEEKSTEVAEGEVISQEPEAGNWEDPDNVNVVITVSTGDQEPSAQSDSADTAASSDAPAQTADNSAAAAAGEVWKCTQTLNTPSGYSGGPVRLELIQNVNGTPTASVVLEDQVIQFPYDLNITGAPGISEGTLYLSEQINGTYKELGNYSITFAKAE